MGVSPTELERTLAEKLRGELGVEVYNPYAYGVNRYKGQLHLHTTNSDGNSSPDAVVAKYRDELGFHFINFSDHEYITSGAPYTVPGTFLAFGGVEEDGYFADHITLIGDATAIPDYKEFPPRVRLGYSYGAIVSRAHINDGNTSILEMLASPLIIMVEGIRGNDTIKYDRYAVSYADLMLRAGKITWITGVDDMHTLATQSGKGWIVVYADELTKPAIMEAILRGAFYATMGPELSFSVDGRTVKCTCSTATKIRAITALGWVKTVKGTSLSYTLKSGDGYVRFEVLDANGNWALSNPFLDLSVFFNLRITQDQIKSAFQHKHMSSTTYNTTKTTTSTDFISAYTGPLEKWSIRLIKRVVVKGIINPSLIGIQFYNGMRYVVPELRIPDSINVLEINQEPLIFPNRQFIVYMRSLDGTSVTAYITICSELIELPYILPECELYTQFLNL